MQPSPLIPISPLLIKNSRWMTNLKLEGMKLSSEDAVTCQLVKMKKVEFRNCHNFAFMKSILTNSASSLTTLHLISVEILPIETDLTHLAHLTLERCTGVEGTQGLLTKCCNTLKSLSLIWCQYSIQQILILPVLEFLEVDGMFGASFNLDLIIQDSTRLKTLKLKNIVHNDEEHEFDFQNLNSIDYLNVQYCEESEWITSLISAASMKLSKLKLVNSTCFTSELEDLPRVNFLKISNNNQGVQWTDLIELVNTCPHVRALDVTDLMIADDEILYPQLFPNLSDLRKLTFRSSHYENLLHEILQACENIEAVYVPSKLAKSIKGRIFIQYILFYIYSNRLKFCCLFGGNQFEVRFLGGRGGGISLQPRLGITLLIEY